MVFARAAVFGELTAGRPAAFRARVGPPTRRDLTVAVLRRPGSRHSVGQAGPTNRRAGARRLRRAARSALPADQAAMLPALVLGDTSALSGRDGRRVSGRRVDASDGGVGGERDDRLRGGAADGGAWSGLGSRSAWPRLAFAAFVVVVQPSGERAARGRDGRHHAAGNRVAAAAGRRFRRCRRRVIVLMIGAPELAVDIGFALSVSATAALVVVAPAWSRRLVGRAAGPSRWRTR